MNLYHYNVYFRAYVDKVLMRMLVLKFTATLPAYFVLRPGKPITVQQGQEAKVKCESEGVTVTKLQWRKQTNSGEVPVPDSMVTVVKDRSTNRVRAILKIANAQKQDGGFYKCVVTVYGKTDYKRIRIDVKGTVEFRRIASL